MYALYVSLRVVGLGAGYALMESALEALRSLGFTPARLWALAGNERAVNFYRRQGWNLTGIQKIEKLPSGVELIELEMTRAL
ncbi:GNAT family N-acetyltransferase [Rothia aerolata]|uniref:GNAT family N-acetyltransferase n=1 Tax=Rothia aerolata TaxID=1812262 RepID=UPI0035A2478C